MFIYFAHIINMELYQSIRLPPQWIGWNNWWDIIKRKIDHIIQFLMFSSLFVGIAGGGMVYVAALIQNVECSPVCIVIMILLGFSVYNLNRKTDEAEDAINRKDRFQFTKKYEKYLYSSALAGYGLAILLAGLNGLTAFFIVLIPLVSGILYSIPCLPPATGYRRLKEIPLVKNLVVGFAWGATLTFIPLAASNSSPTLASVISLLFFSTYAFIASTLPDIRDKEGDELSGIRTIPVVIGVERTLFLVTSLNILIGCIAVILSSIYLTVSVAILIAVSMVYMHMCIRTFVRVKRKDLICDILTDGQFLFIGLFVYGVGILVSSLTYTLF
jgi:4-hydroxybenzoate polyprenyltransferase